MLVTPLFNVKEVKAVIFLKAVFPIVPLFITAEVNGLPSNAEIPILVTLFGTIIDVKSELKKALFPMVTKLLGKVIEVKPLVLENVEP
jgi:hypothetical protein